LLHGGFRLTLNTAAEAGALAGKVAQAEQSRQAQQQAQKEAESKEHSEATRRRGGTAMPTRLC